MDLSQVIITGVRAVEVRGVPFSVGLVPPWNPAQRITTRDYVVVRVETSAGAFGLSMDGDYTPGLPASAAAVRDLVAHIISRHAVPILDSVYQIAVYVTMTKTGVIPKRLVKSRVRSFDTVYFVKDFYRVVADDVAVVIRNWRSPGFTLIRTAINLVSFKILFTCQNIYRSLSLRIPC